MNKAKTISSGRNPTQWWIIFIAAYVVIVAGIGCWVWINTLKFENEAVRRTQQQLLTIAKSESQRIEEFINNNLSEAKMLAKDQYVINYFKDGLKAKSLPEAGPYPEESLFEYFRGKADSIHWLNAKGIVLGGFPFEEEIIGSDESRDPDVKFIIENHTSNIDIFEANSGKRFLCICNPVIENGNFLGLTRVLVSLDTINNLVNTVKVGMKGYAWIISERGIMMAHPKPEHRGVDIMTVRKEAFPDFNWSELEGIVRKMKIGEEGFGTYQSAWWTEEKLGIVRKLTAFSPININEGPGLWSIGVSLSYDEIAGPIKKNMINNFIGAGFLLLVFGIGGVVLFRTQKRKTEMEIIAKSAESMKTLNEKLQLEIAERKKIEEEMSIKSSFLKLHSMAAVSANEAKEIDDAFRPILKGVCSYTNWPIGHVYIISKNDPNLLGPTDIWNIKDHGRFSKFCEITKLTKFKKGRGLPGRVMADGRPHWIKDISKDFDFPRLPTAKEVGIKAGFAFPVMVGPEVVAVLEFFSTEIIEADSKLMEVVSDVGTQLGRVFERKKAEEEHIKTQKLESVGVLAGGIAHDFNNYLQGILSNIALAKKYTETNAEAYNSLTASENAVIQAKQLCKQLLTFSKGGGPIKKVIYVPELIEESANFALSGSNIRCEYELRGISCLVEADRGQMYQVFNNLLINADQAMPEGGIIKVTTEHYNVQKNDLLPLHEGRYVKITFKDQGIGIPQEHLQKIFDPYFTTKEMGSGLGLATCFSIIKKHDGHITAESGPGTGTTFHIYLPALKEEMSRKTVLAEAEASYPNLVDEKQEQKRVFLEGKRILFMDDDLLIAKSVSMQLRELKYEVEIARNGNKAIELYKKAMISGDPFDAVIMDLTIVGGMGGTETIKELIEIDTDVNAIVVSGYTNGPEMSNFKEYGFKGVVAKPYEIYELDDALHKVILKENE